MLTYRPTRVLKVVQRPGDNIGDPGETEIKQKCIIATGMLILRSDQVRSASIGFALDARAAWYPTVATAIKAAKTPLNANSSHPIVIR